MNEKIHVIANNYLRKFLPEIYQLNVNQSVDDFVNFFVKDEVFSIGLISRDNKEIQTYINEVKEIFGFDKKIMIVDLDKLTQEWNEMIYAIKQEKSLENYFYQIIKTSILARKFKNEKIGVKDYDIDESFHFYKLSDVNEIILITNNSLLLKTESQRMGYVNKYLDCINGGISSKKKRKTIPKKVKNDLWVLYFGDNNAKGGCYVCKTEIHISTFEAGHVIPDSAGGEPTIDNLKPVCGQCNKSMGEENLYKYKEKYYPSK